MTWRVLGEDEARCVVREAFDYHRCWDPPTVIQLEEDPQVWLELGWYFANPHEPAFWRDDIQLFPIVVTCTCGREFPLRTILSWHGWARCMASSWPWIVASYFCNPVRNGRTTLCAAGGMSCEAVREEPGRKLCNCRGCRS